MPTNMPVFVCVYTVTHWWLQQSRVNPLSFHRMTHVNTLSVSLEIVQKWPVLKRKCETKTTAVALGAGSPLMCMSGTLPPLAACLCNPHPHPQDASVSQTGNEWRDRLLTKIKTCDLNMFLTISPLKSLHHVVCLFLFCKEFVFSLIVFGSLRCFICNVKCYDVCFYGVPSRCKAFVNHRKNSCYDAMRILIN